MGCTRFALPMAVIGMTVVSLASAGEPSRYSTPSYSSNSKTSSTQPAPVRDTLRSLTGEWQGQIEVRRNDKVSVSIVSASNRFDSDGNFVSAFSGFAFGKMYDGAIVFQMDRGGFPSGYASTQDFGVEGMLGTFQLGQDGSLVAIGKPGGSTRPNTNTVGQVTSVVNPSTYTTEWFETTPSGEQISVVKMTFHRLGRGEQADASSIFESKGFQNWNELVRVRSAKTAEVAE